MKLADLKWDGPENMCQSLRILAELARRGELRVRASHPSTEGDPPQEIMRIAVFNPVERKRT